MLFYQFIQGDGSARAVYFDVVKNRVAIRQGES
jgi:hypothetical protein